jgi:outer membrane lipoprotein SlyB
VLAPTVVRPFALDRLRRHEPQTQTQKGTAVGAGVGAVAGAAIGRDGKGAAIGAGLGALGGYMWSKRMEDKKAAMEQRHRRHRRGGDADARTTSSS